MKNDPTHPARSADFLSRLHDGELNAAERVQFESHRDRCAECRRAAAEFEAALSLFRRSSPSAPPPDLAARILRRLKTASPRRSRVGVVFGIDMRWAAAFVVAIIAVIVGSSVVLQRESARREVGAGGPIPVILRGGESAVRPSPAPARPETMPQAAARPESLAPAPAASPGPFAQEPPRPAIGGERRVQTPEELASPLRTEARRDRPSRPPAFAEPQALRSERSGGEGAASSSAASAEPIAPARLVFIPLDGEGTAPDLATPNAGDLLADLRGHEYLLLVEAGGRVREASSSYAKKTVRPRTMARDAVSEVSAPSSVRSLRFKPGDRPRRLLLKIQ
jgi:anti-sigma factor RsiW